MCYTATSRSKSVPAQECHGSVEVMEIKRFGSRKEVIFSPTFRGSIAATGKKPMQHGEINGPLNVKVVAASFEQRSNYLVNPAFFPEPPKDQVLPIFRVPEYSELSIQLGGSSTSALPFR